MVEPEMELAQIAAAVLTEDLQRKLRVVGVQGRQT
jgi:hypothetical protein